MVQEYNLCGRPRWTDRTLRIDLVAQYTFIVCHRIVTCTMHELWQHVPSCRRIEVPNCNSINPATSFYSEANQPSKLSATSRHRVSCASEHDVSISQSQSMRSTRRPAVPPQTAMVSVPAIHFPHQHQVVCRIVMYEGFHSQLSRKLLHRWDVHDDIRCAASDVRRRQLVWRREDDRKLS